MLAAAGPAITISDKRRWAWVGKSESVGLERSAAVVLAAVVLAAVVLAVVVLAVVVLAAVDLPAVN